MSDTIETLADLEQIEHDKWLRMAIEKMQAKMHVLDDRIILIPAKAPEKIGRIWIPEVARENMRSLEGTVVSMGPGMKTKKGGRWPMPDLKPGDHVFYGPKYGGTSYEYDGVVYLILREDYVHAVREP